MKKDLWINGSWVEAPEYQPLKNPFNNEVIGETGVASAQQVRQAIDAADAATKKMASLYAWERAEILFNVVTLLKEKKEEAARIIALEASKPIRTARGEVERTIQTYQFAGEEAKKIAGEMVPMDAAPGGAGKTGFVKREPLGIIGAITPFNFPFNLVAHKLGPAIATGNAVVLKPASQTPLSAFFIADLFHQAGLPAGALNVITGSGSVVGNQLVTDDRVKMITFTGSPEVGKQIRQQAGLKRVTLELGSNSAIIIDEGTDLTKIVPKVVMGAFSFQGQVCISIQRIYVHASLYDVFLEMVKVETEKLKGGNALDEDTDYSALISSGDADRVINWVEEAVSQGAKVLTGGYREGNAVHPTLLKKVPAGMKITCQEVFGPVAVIYSFEEMDKAIDHVNDSIFGLQAGIYTPLISHALHAAERLEVGGVMINDIPTFRVDQMPYGGVKDSGMGREGIHYAVEEMTEMKLITMQPEP